MEREQTTIRLPAELMEQLRREAQEIGMSFNDYKTRIKASTLAVKMRGGLSYDKRNKKGKAYERAYTGASSKNGRHASTIILYDRKRICLSQG